MCDTMIATGLITAQGKSIFAKNSDRQPNEGQGLVWIPAKVHDQGSSLRCTYISIPQVKETHAVLLSQPFWMWGGEMGVNEHGLVIGNEAVFSKIPANKTPALLGMDLLRLGLERAVTPHEAVNVIVELLEQFGQGGNCVHNGELYYHNSFIIANHEDAWVLEVVDKDWVARQVKDLYSISNCLTIQNEWDMASKSLIEQTTQDGTVGSGQDFNYARQYSDFIYTTFGKGFQRRETTANIIQENTGAVTVRTLMKVLRHHENGNSPGDNITHVDVCMHAGFGPVRASQSTASMVVLLGEKRPTVFATGTSAPCTSIFKPLWVDAPLPDPGPAPTGIYDPATPFWSHERLHRAVLLNFPERIAAYASDRDALESKFVQGALKLVDAPVKDRAAYTAECFRQAAFAEEEWLERVQRVPTTKPFGRLLNDLAWTKFNQMAKIPA
jgi:secernin